MTSYTYKIVPAPERARKIKGAKGPDLRFARTLEEDINALAAEGWEFVRSETFEVEERAGFTGKKSVDRQVLVFRKPKPEPGVADTPLTLRAVPDPAGAAEDQPAEAARGPRILGRPVPPMSRDRGTSETGTEPE